MVKVGDPQCWIPTPELEALLNRALRGLSLAGFPNRTRSKVLKQNVCETLGYPIPTSFKKTQPRFPGQSFDTYVQKSNNLQVWNEELSPDRRYVIIRVSDVGIVSRVKVVTGRELASFDRTGTVTTKYQAQCLPREENAELVTPNDTTRLAPFVSRNIDLGTVVEPVKPPQAGQLLSVCEIFTRLGGLIGRRFSDPGADQERNRGGVLHRLVCEALGYKKYGDNGKFPDVRHQILEVKLQTSPTIDLGLVRPDSIDALDDILIHGQQVRHCDVRYAIFYAQSAHDVIKLTHLFVTTGEVFFTRFPQFGGKVRNRKIQIPLPSGFFD